MERNDLRHGKKNVPQKNECAMKSNKQTKRTFEASKSGLTFRKPFTDTAMEDDRKLV